MRTHHAPPGRPNPGRWTELATKLSGSVVTVDDASFQEARTVWNGAVDRIPEAIVRCAEPEDVVAALEFAARHGVPATPRSGGHSMAGLSAPEGGMVVDLSCLAGIDIDVDARRARVQAGVLGRDLDVATQHHGLGTTLGTISHTGVAGLTLGGGMGWVMRSYGLASDNVCSMQVVLADGSRARASADENPELFWALRGGGGGVAVVTEFEFELHTFGPQTALAQYAFDADDALDALKAARDLARGAPRQRDLWLTHITRPSDAELGSGGTYAVMGFSTDPEDTDWLAPLGVHNPTWQQVESVDYVAVQTAFDDSNPHGTRAFGKGAFVPELDDETLEVFVEHASHAPDDTVSYLQQMGGAVADPPGDGGAVQGRTADYVFNVIGRWDRPNDLAAAHHHTRRCIAAMQRHAGPHPPLNFESDVVTASRDREFFPDDVGARLRRIKSTFDPEGILRSEHL